MRLYFLLVYHLSSLSILFLSFVGGSGGRWQGCQESPMVLTPFPPPPPPPPPQFLVSFVSSLFPCKSHIPDYIFYYCIISLFSLSFVGGSRGRWQGCQESPTVLTPFPPISCLVCFPINHIYQIIYFLLLYHFSSLFSLFLLGEVGAVVKKAQRF